MSSFEYDNYASDSNHAAVAANSGMIKYDGSRFASFTSTLEPRGLVTKVSRWAGGTNYVTSYSQYDNAGNVIWIKDPNLNVSTVSYTDNFGGGSNPDSGSQGTNGATFALPTLATNALGHVAKSQYDYTRGVATGVKDPNGIISKSEYDNIGRPFRMTAALGLSEQAITEVTYPTVSSNVSTTSTQLDSTRWMASKVTYDGFDRPITAAQAEDGQHASSASFNILSKTEYDELGRPFKGSNPYRSGETPIYTTSSFDLGGRVTTITTPDGAQVTTAYDSEKTTVTDQAGKTRRSVTDALGRLKEVIEDPIGTNALNYSTTYSYDTLDNLTGVSQGVQTRSFAYDQLKRLISASNPESGTISYEYDANSNLKTKTDPRLLANNTTHITTTFAYDELNRVETRTYNDGTPIVTYVYDATSVSNSKGRLTSVSSSVSASSYSGYDAMGRVTGSSQTIDGQTYSMSYSYNLAGALVSETYPSGRIVTTNFDGAGRLSAVNGQKTGEANKTYASSISYTAHGALAEMKLGNNLWEHTIFNNRLQPMLIGLGTSQSIPNPQDFNRFRVDYSYGGTSNNGNVLQQTITVPDASGNEVAQMSQYYTYDELNRLKSATEISGGTQSWKQTFVYDRYGNRTFDTDSSKTTANALSSTLTIDSINNRFTAGQGSILYDNAGNLTREFNGHTFGYDGENKQVTYDGGATTSGGASYSYDGDGKRVKKVTGVSLETTIFAYDAFGQMVAEYSSAAQSGTGSTSFLTSDTLGTPRVITDTSGGVKARHDYMPFGEEVGLAGGRTAPQGYVADNVNQKFALKERNLETGLDYLGARYYASSHGRFMSADKPFADQSELLPQSWNLYSYVQNNPLRFTDPTGEGHDEEIEGEKHWVGDEDGEYDPEIRATWRVDSGRLLGGYWDFGGDQSPVNVEERSDVLVMEVSRNGETIGYIEVPIYEPGLGGLRNVARSAARGGRGVLTRFWNWLTRGSSLNLTALIRQDYEVAVRQLASIASKMRQAGHSTEEIAIKLHALRRALGMKYKDLTPSDLLQKIYQRNLEKYGDELGPTIEWLRTQGKTWDEIIESAARPGGTDLVPK